jgi:molybdenum cofactor cytidylyltransferase
VLGDDADAIEAAIDWHGERRVSNPDPAQGLSSSVRIGMAAVPASAARALIVLGDQPAINPETVRTVLEQPEDPSRPVVVARYEDDSARNPVLLERAAFPLVAEATGDRGLGPVLAAHPELVREVIVSGSNPDVDTPADLGRAAEASWAPAYVPTASRSSESARCPTARISTRRSARCSVPTPPEPTTRPRRAA